MRNLAFRFTTVVLAAAGGLGLTSAGPLQDARQPTGSKLRLETVGSDSTAFDVTATLVIGPTEVLLWDAQYHLADARRVADRIAATGKRLKAIIISHPDHDHYAGAAAIVERFPGTPVWMTARALSEFEKTGSSNLAAERRRRPAMFADSLVTPVVLSSVHLTVDGEAVEVIPDLAGDVLAPTNSILWIPSLAAVLAGDVVFRDVHPWLAASTPATRAAWRGSLERIADLHPAIVVAGHDKDVTAPDSPDVVQRMLEYLEAFDRVVDTSSSADQVVRRMLGRYADHAVANLLRSSASRAIPRPVPGGVNAAQARDIITDGNRVWGRARLEFDRAVFERMLTGDFHVQIDPDNRLTRQEFIDQISTMRPNLRLTRFDATVLTVEPDGDDGWAALIQEKVESQGNLMDGTPFHSYSLWITRDGWRRIGDEWKIAYSNAVSVERWQNTRPPLPNW